MNSVNYKRLEKSLTDVIQEAQLKIGYDHHPITLYYPTESVAQVTRDDKRFCFHISAEGTQYVHEQLPDPAFLRAFLQVMCGLTVSFDDILAVFHQFSNKVHCEKLEGNEEFDYLVYFEDGTPDSYRYCIKLDDDGDAVYHRFTPEDYAAFGF